MLIFRHKKAPSGAICLNGAHEPRLSGGLGLFVDLVLGLVKGLDGSGAVYKQEKDNCRLHFLIEVINIIKFQRQTGIIGVAL